MIIYKIFYKEHQVFDIELTLNEAEHSGLYYSDLCIMPCIQGVAYYIFENVKTPEELKIAIAKCEEIADMRVILWEDPAYDNSPLFEKAAEDRHYKIVKPRVEENLKNFCKTMGFSMFTD